MRLSVLFSVLALGAAASLSGCDLNPYPLGSSSNVNDGGVGDGDGGDNGDGGVDPTVDSGVCIPSGLDDQCDDVDNDCDGTVDEAIDKENDNANCGSCGNRCTALGAVLECQTGECVLLSCQPGFKNLDTSTADCEYVCPVFPEQAEDCNGIDDDCDGLVDLADPDIIAPPSGQCRTTAGTPCAGTGMVCETRGAPGLTRWYCDYSAEVEFDPTVPNGIVQQETLCDGFDGDCDAIVDDPFSVGGDCNNGALGICFDDGALICDPADNTQTTCDFNGNALPPVLEQDISECNAIDEDCDGSIDEGDHSVWVDIGGNVEMMAFEASRPDADGADAGQVEAIGPCSKSNTIPWTDVQYGEADALCTAIGARLCTEAEWESTCSPNVETITNVIVEAEDNDAVVDGSGTRTWTETSDTDGDPASGGLYMRALPDDRATEFGSVGAAADSQRMDFGVVLPTAGTWYVWIRGRRGGSGGCQDFVWFGEGAPGVATPEYLFKQFNSSTWLWYSNDVLSFRASVEAPADNFALDFSLWMGCNDVRIDKIAFSSDEGYIPTLVSDPPATVDQDCRFAYDEAMFSCLDYVPGVCNDSGYADPDEVFATGTELACFADPGGGSVFDMTGNVKEWTETRGGAVNPIRGGAFNSGAAGTTCQFTTTADDDFRFSNIGFRCCRDI